MTKPASAPPADALPPLPPCWSGSPVTITWAEDGERTTREVYTADQMRQYANAALAASAQVREAEDAQRYRWLRQLRQENAEVIGRWGAGCGDDPAWLDAAIDAAMKESTVPPTTNPE